MSRFELLVGADAFRRRLEGDIASASSRVLLQAMTFEGDAAGLAVADAVRRSDAEDRRILIDAYTRVIVSDTFIHTPASRRNEALQAEVAATHGMVRDLEAGGAGVQATNPVGFAMVRFPARNHRKLMVVDDVAYLGGVNFSDHNFAWHDLMVRIADGAIAEHLADEFNAGWAGVPRAESVEFKGAVIHTFDGRSNPRGMHALHDLVAGARTSIHAISPYLTFPFLGALREARRRGVPVTLLTPEPNNKPVVRDYLLWDARRAGFDVRLQPAMTHLKALLVDEETLVVGSSNFDVMSHYCQEEIVAAITDRALVADFHARVLDRDLAASRPLDFRVRAARGWTCYGLLKLGEWAARASIAFAGRPRGAVPWRES